MHVLTKIFVVLVALMAVLLTPLVVVYAYNEDSYQARYQTASGQAQVARTALNEAEQGFAADRTRLLSETDRLTDVIASLRSNLSESEAANRDLRTNLAQTQSAQDDFRVQLETLAHGVTVGQDLITKLLSEVEDSRRMAMTAEQHRVDLDERLRDVVAELEVERDTRRAFEEQLNRVNGDFGTALDTVAQYVALYGSLAERNALGIPTRVAVAEDIHTSVASVITSADQKLATLPVGSRDGVKKDVVFLISEGAQFIANLRIIEVDINKCTGVVELEDARGRGAVRAGQSAMVKAGG